MIRSSNGVRLLSSHLIRDACRSIYEGVFHRTMDSGVWTLSRVIGGGRGGHATVNLNNSVLPNTSIRGSDKILPFSLTMRRILRTCTTQIRFLGMNSMNIR